MFWNFINLRMYMKGEPVPMPCQKQSGIGIQMRCAWVSVLYLICGPIPGLR